MKNTVLIFIEQRDGEISNVSFELLSETKRILEGEDVAVKGIFLTDKMTDEQLNDLAVAGADEIILLEDKRFKVYDTNNYSSAIKNAFEDLGRPEVFLIGSTLIGRDLAPRISAKIHTGLTADATVLDFEFQDDKVILNATRPALGGNIMATIQCLNHVPQMASIRPGVFSVINHEGNKCEVKKVKPRIDHKSGVEVLGQTEITGHTSNLDKARLVIAGGRGVAKQLKNIQELARLVGGEMAVSRAVVDAQLAPKHQQVGQTGTTVKPLVYVASGISGAIQHIAGMEKSEMIIAINTDPKALIFDIADVSIIADANKVLPLLIEEVKVLRHYKEKE